MKGRLVGAAGSPLLLVLTCAMGAAVLALAVYGYRAMHEWRRSAGVIADRAAQDGADLLVTALMRDMRGAQAQVLANRDAGDYAAQSPADFSNQVAAAFTRFPYPESFFGSHAGGDIIFFNRANRPPPWGVAAPRADRYPVIVVESPPIARTVLAHVMNDAAQRRTYSDFYVHIDGVPYEVVARLQYRDGFRDRLESFTGFTVNLAWVRDRYFSEIVSQVARIGERGVTLDYAVLDQHGGEVAGVTARGPAVLREFPLQFFDPAVAELLPRDDSAPAVWRVRVSAANDPNLVWVTRGEDWTLLVMGLTALALVLSFFLIARAVRASAALTEMRSEFVSTVTHELKTPISTIRAVADTMRRGRLQDGGIRDYAGLLVQESRRLSRLVDNLLAYARVTDVTELYSYERIAPAELIEDALGGFEQQLTSGHFDVVTEVPHDLPLVRGDRTALRLALDNLIDNAIRYSSGQHWLRIAARREHSGVVIEVRDHGQGIPAHEIEAVQQRFVRGRGVRTHGSGLGLAIVRRVVGDHAGRFELMSQPGVGTVARFNVPVYED